MGKVSSTTSLNRPTIDELRRRVDNALENGKLNLVTSSQVIARANGMIKVDLTSRTMPDLTSYVNAGAKLLDEHNPGWWRTIDVAKLDLDDENYCLLGQGWSHYVQGRQLTNAIISTESAKAYRAGSIETNFRRFLARLFPDRKGATALYGEASHYGFQIPDQVCDWVNYEGRRLETERGTPRNPEGRGWCWAVLDQVWEHLTATWIVLIQARQDAAQAQVEALAAELNGLSPEEIARKVLEHRN